VDPKDQRIPPAAPAMAGDFADCGETYPGAAWPEQAIRSLRSLIRAWHAAREQGLPAIPAKERNCWRPSSAASGPPRRGIDAAAGPLDAHSTSRPRLAGAQQSIFAPGAWLSVGARAGGQ
jgi:hypothetical protein